MQSIAEHNGKLHPETGKQSALPPFWRMACLLAFLGLALQLGAQNPIIQRGMVREINSGKTPIPGATIIFSDAKAEVSDQGGQFRLVFQEKQPGDLIFKEEIRKQGYELVNEKDFEIVKISNTDQLGVDVILAVEGTVDAAKKTYYNVSDAALLAGFKREKDALRAKLQETRISQQEYLNQLTALQEEYERQRESLDALAEKFARVNFDDVAPYYEEALKLFKEGQIDEAIEVLESANPARRTEQIIAEEKRIALAQAELDSQRVALAREKQKQIAAVRLLADMYSLKFDPAKAEAQYDQLVRLDSTDLEILSDAADFYREQHLYDEAFPLYPLIIAHPEAEAWQRANAYGHLGELFTNTGNLPKALKVFEQVTYAYDTLRRSAPTHSFYKNNLAISYEKLGSTYTALGQLDSALVFFQDYELLKRELYEAYPQNVNFKNGLAISYVKLASIYLRSDLTEAITFLKKAETLFSELVDHSPGNVQYQQYLTIVRDVLSKLATTEADERVKMRINTITPIEEQIEEETEPSVKVTLQQAVVDSLLAIRQSYPTNATLATRLANAYGSLAWYQLFNRQFAEAEQAAAAGLATDPQQEWINTNLALGLLFQGKLEEAKAIYSAFKGNAYNAQTSWNEVFLQDLEALEAEGITHPDVERVRAFLKD